MTLFRGATSVREWMRAFLATDVPLMHIKAETQWQADVPEPMIYTAYEPTGMDHRSGPLVAVGVERAGGMRAVDISDYGEQQYQTEYRIRIYVWCFTPEAEDGLVAPEARVTTIRTRDDLTAIVRATLLNRPSLGQPEALLLVQGTLTEEYSEITPVPNASGRWVAGAVLSFTCRVDESLFNASVTQIPEQGVEVNHALLPRQ